MLRAAKVCRSGNRSSSNSISARRVARDVPAVGQDLALQFVRQAAGDGADVAAVIGKTERGVAERDQHQQPRHAVGNVQHGVAQIADLAREAAQVAAVEAAVGVAEQQRRLRQEGDHAPRQHVGAPGGLARLMLRRQPFVDQRARIGAGDGRIGGAQMPQPAEAEQRDFPVFRRRIEREHRAAVAGDDLAGEDETAGIDLGGARGVGGAQFLRRDQKLVGAAGPDAPQRERVPARPRQHVPGETGSDQTRNTSVVGD